MPGSRGWREEGIEVHQEVGKERVEVSGTKGDEEGRRRKARRWKGIRDGRYGNGDGGDEKVGRTEE